MLSTSQRPLATLILALAGLSIAPAAPDDRPKTSPLADARYQSALRQYEIAWSYYKQARIDSYQVYVWSRLVLDAHRDQTAKRAARLVALEEHLARMKKLEDLVNKVRRLGFGRSFDVGASEYYRLEAEHWVELAREGRKPLE